MTGMLASVRSLAEARLVLAAGVDLIDLKDPSSGALGALDGITVQRIVKFVNGRTPVSATVGDLPCEARMIDRAIAARATCGVDLVKVGVFAGAVGRPMLRVLERRSIEGTRIVLVFFAEWWRDSRSFPVLRDAGIAGVMLDTADKRAGPLTGRLSIESLASFVHDAHRTGLMSGLAGSLSAVDARRLLPLCPDYLGFRGALCAGGRRGRRVDPQALSVLRKLPWTGMGTPGAPPTRTAA